MNDTGLRITRLMSPTIFPLPAFLQISTSVLLRLPHVTEMLFALTMRDLMHVPVMQDSLEMDQPAMVCELIEV